MAKANVMGLRPQEKLTERISAKDAIGSLRMVMFPESTWTLIQEMAKSEGTSCEHLLSKALSEFGKSRGYV
jgi:hypothetical protein